jgi:PAS domain S-box-containing protein
LLNNFSRFLPAVFFQYQRFSDERFCFNYASDAVERLFEFSAAELCADVNILFSKVHPADLPAFMLSVRTAAKDLRLWTHEFRIVLKNGEERWMAGEASPERQEDGSLLWHGCFMDQTRSKKTERI